MSSKPIFKETLGQTSDGKDVFVFTLEAGPVKVRILNFGCVVKDILVPDRHGAVTDVCLGYDTFEGYEQNPAFMGAICGRVANRIDGASFKMDGKTYQVSKNDPLGNNMCHGGFKGLTRRYFDWKIEGTKLILSYTDVDGAEGFPGDVNVVVTYELTSENGLMIDYQANTNKVTPVDISNHFMFNLAGHSAGYIGDHVVTLNTSQKLDFNDKFIPTGAISAVENTVFDMRQPTLLSDVLDKMPNKDGLHHAHILSGKKGEKKLVARAEHPASGRCIEVFTTEPVFISYSCYYLDVLLGTAQCKGETVYQKSGGLLFMPQGYPNAVNQENFPSCILRPGETYHTTSWYKFGVIGS